MNSTPSTEEGSRYNEGKLPIGLVPPEAIKGLTAVLAFGAQKYAPRNWEKGLSWTETYESLMRHMLAWLQGEDTDPESGLPHIDHALFNVAALSTFQKRAIGSDDRPKLEPKKVEKSCPSCLLKEHCGIMTSFMCFGEGMKLWIPKE